HEQAPPLGSANRRVYEGSSTSFLVSFPASFQKPDFRFEAIPECRKLLHPNRACGGRAPDQAISDYDLFRQAPLYSPGRCNDFGNLLPNGVPTYHSYACFSSPWCCRATPTRSPF